MSVATFLAELRERDVRVWADGDRLRCNAPPGVLTTVLQEQLRRRKPEILEFLRAARSLARRHRAIVPLQPRGTAIPIFAVPGHNGDVFSYRHLARTVGADQPLYGLQPPGLDGGSRPLTCIEDLAAHFAQQIRTFHPAGPCVIAGFCAGGMTAFELGRQLLQDRPGVTVALLGAGHPSRYQRFRVLGPKIGLHLELVITAVLKHARLMLSRRPGTRWAYLAEKLRRHRERRVAKRAAGPGSALVLRAQVERATLQAARRYTPRAFKGRVVLLAPDGDWLYSRDVPLRWRAVAEEFAVFAGPEGCDSDNMLQEPYVETFAKRLRRHTFAVRKSDLVGAEAAP